MHLSVIHLGKEMSYVKVTLPVSATKGPVVRQRHLMPSDVAEDSITAPAQPTLTPG